MTSQKTETIIEGKTKILVFRKKTSKKGPGTKDSLPFYNPSMELNRDLSIFMVQFLVNNSKKHVDILDGLSASGIRGIRFANEIKGDFDVTVNDWYKDAYDLIIKNLKQHELKNVVATNKNLNVLLSENRFDYIDIDPFGSPVGFVDSAMRSIKNGGVVACTATDTATLCGVYPRVCWRRYGAMPFHSPVMKEIGMRILLGFICREAGKYDRGIEPLICYSTDHYFRVYVRVQKGVKHANNSMKNLSYIRSDDLIFSKNNNVDIGPLWIENLQDKKVIQEVRTILFEKELGTKHDLWKLLDVLEEESDGPRFFYTTGDLASIWKCSPPKTKKIFEKLNKKGYKVCRTHFNTTGFKTDAPLKEIEKIFKN